MMDEIVKKQGGRKRKDRIRRSNLRKAEKDGALGANNSGNTSSGGEQPRRTSTKRDAHGHFVKETVSLKEQLAAIPDYLMPLYQVRRAPTYTPRSTPFHNNSRMTLAREIKEMGLGVAVGPMGYVTTAECGQSSHGRPRRRLRSALSLRCG